MPIAAMPTAARLSGVLLTLLFGAGALAGQEFPSRPLKMIVPYPAGGITDVLPRGTPQQTAEFVRHEAALWKKVIADIGIAPE
jgi:hypothetical protein